MLFKQKHTNYFIKGTFYTTGDIFIANSCNAILKSLISGFLVRIGSY